MPEMRVHPVQSVPEGIEGGGGQGMASDLEGFAGLQGLVPELADDLSRQVQVPSVDRGVRRGSVMEVPMQPLAPAVVPAGDGCSHHPLCGLRPYVFRNSSNVGGEISSQSNS